MHWVVLDSNGKKIFKYLLFFSFIYVFPIILADRYYNDDLARSFLGQTGWVGDGRPLTEYLMRLLSGGLPVVDVSPLPLLLGIFLFVYFLTLYFVRNFGDTDSPLLSAFVLCFAFIGPYMLPNLSYKFDVLSMMMALACMYLCFSFPSSWSQLLKVLVCFSLIFVSLALYQPVIGVYLSLFLLRIYQKKGLPVQALRSELHYLFSLLAAGILYKLTIAELCVAKDGWRAQAGEYISPTNISSVLLVIQNLKRLCVSMKEAYSPLFALLVCTIITVAILFVVFQVRAVWTGAYKNKLLWSLFFCFLPFGMFLASVAPLVFLKNYSFKSRMLICLSAFFLFFGLILGEFCRKNKLLRAIIGTVLALNLLFSFCYLSAYANAQKAQKDYETYLATNIVHDLETISQEITFNAVTIEGTTPKSPLLEKLCRKFPQFNEIVPVYISNSTWIGGVWLQLFSQQWLNYEETRDSDLQIVETSAPIIGNSIYSCYVNGDKVIVSFHE